MFHSKPLVALVSQKSLYLAWHLNVLICLCAERNALQGNKFQFMKNPRTGANIKAIKDIQEIGPICSHRTAKHASCLCP